MSKRQWRLQDAKTQLSQVVEAALQGEPQHITRRGKPAVVVLSEAAFDAFKRNAQAVAIYRRMVAVDPSYDEARIMLGNLLAGPPGEDLLPLLRGIAPESGDTSLLAASWQLLAVAAGRASPSSRQSRMVVPERDAPGKIIATTWPSPTATAMVQVIWSLRLLPRSQASTATKPMPPTMISSDMTELMTQSSRYLVKLSA